MREKPDLVGHQKFAWEEIEHGNPPPINNLIIEPKKDEDKWIKATTEKIGDWRAYFRSTYIRWALTLNALHVAEERYKSKIGEPIFFRIDSLRQNGIITIAQWDTETTFNNYRATIPMMGGWGLIDLYGCLEEFVFSFYRIFLDHHPDSIMKGAEFSELRRLKKEAKSDEKCKEKWQRAWTERLENWQRKRLYDGLHRVFLAYANVAGLKTPSIYKLSTIDTWAETIKGIGELRNCFTHGVEVVTKNLADFSTAPHSMQFDFKEGEKLSIELRHLQSVECFLDSLLTAMNLSLIERAGYPLPRKIQKA